MKAGNERLVHIPSGSVFLEGMLELPASAQGVVLFAHGSGSSRHSPRNNFVAARLRDAGLATLLIDLLTPEEDRDYERRFDIALLVERLHDAVRWLSAEPTTQSLRVGLFGASTGAAAALQLAAAVPSKVTAVVSRGGRPDLAGAVSLERVKAPTLLVVGGDDTDVLALNEGAYAHLHCPKSLFIVPGATHLFEEAGTLEVAASHAAEWFTRHLAPAMA
ncbi:MAG: alpha/beta hydrolase [Betaproteobacteria bacterium]|nr:alpha/beta hydrolase [Betaproteobacteria bacterium]